MTTKICWKCQKEKSLITGFSTRRGAKDGYWNICNDCKTTKYLPWNRNERKQGDRYVYLVGAENGLVKIGIAASLTSRVSNIQTGSPVKTVLLFSAFVVNAGEIEHELHVLLRETYSHGEWFFLSVEQIEQAKEIILNRSEYSDEYSINNERQATT